jgi:hypothetical protein
MKLGVFCRIRAIRSSRRAVASAATAVSICSSRRCLGGGAGGRRSLRERLGRRAGVAFVEFRERRDREQALDVDPLRLLRQEFASLVGGGEDAPAGRGDQSGLAHVELGPVDAVVEHALSAARQALFAFGGREAELVGDPLGGVRHTDFAAGRQSKEREHDRLVVWYGQGRVPCDGCMAAASGALVAAKPAKRDNHVLPVARTASRWGIASAAGGAEPTRWARRHAHGPDPLGRGFCGYVACYAKGASRPGASVRRRAIADRAVWVDSVECMFKRRRQCFARFVV